MKTWLKKTTIEVAKMLSVITAISVCLTIAFYPFLMEQNLSESLIVLRIFIGALLGLLFWFAWLYIPYARKEKNWSVKNFLKYKWRKMKEATMFFFKDTVATLKALLWFALLVGIVIALLFLFGGIVASLSATTIIIILLVLILLK
jgi:hypothetical protein